jgi:endoglucanase
MRKSYLIRWIVVVVAVYFVNSTNMAQTPFSRGVNLSTWFQTSTARQIQFTKYTKKDFENIKSLGCDVIRLPINLFHMTSGSPNYTVDPLFYTFLDQAVSWAEDLQIYLLIDNHTTDDWASQNPNLQTALVKVWEQVASHYQNRSGFIMYEVMNEPNGLTTASWGAIQQKGIDAIRKYDSVHTIIVGASAFNSYSELNLLPVYTDKNLIYTFHFYDPFLFTHQGASWPVPPLTTFTNVPFPYNASTMPAMPTSFTGTWYQSAYNNYKTDGTVAHLKQLIDGVIAFKNNRQANVYCGEFGVYKPYSKDADRLVWYEEVRKYLEQNGISWTIWDYQNSFGLFENGTGEMFDYDLNIPLVKALGLIEPSQSIFSITPESSGFTIYDDFIGEKITEASYGNNATIDYYSANQPNNGNYCLFWTGTAQYGALSFNFMPDKDLTALKTQNYAISLWVKGNTPGTRLELRFIDTKTTSASDHPWRMNFALDESVAKWDGQWHQVYIPLKNFTEQGAWDNNTWYNPIGAFDWKAIDKFEINSDQGSLAGKSFWFDNIMITNTTTTSIDKKTASNGLSLDVFPNPVKESTTISYNLDHVSLVEVSIYTLAGQKLKTLVSGAQVNGSYLVTWNGDCDNGSRVSRQLCICQLKTANGIISKRLMVL